MHINFKHLIKLKRFWAGVLLAQFFLFYFLSQSPQAVDLFVNFFEKKKVFQQYLFSKIPFSLGDELYILLLFCLVILSYKLGFKKSRSRSLHLILIILNLFYFIYQMSWGMLYFQQPIMPSVDEGEVQLSLAKELSQNYLNFCIMDRQNVPENEAGVFKIENLTELENAILREQKKISLYQISTKATLINNFKPSIFSKVMSFTGILGYYNPLTTEAQYDRNLPASVLAFTLAHESAHQLGFAREQEANFVGYLIGKNSRNPSLRYATDLFVLKSLLAYIYPTDPKFCTFLIKNYSPAMMRDRIFEKQFRAQHDSFLDDVFYMTNNLFLKSNQQEGSITYSYFTKMLLRQEMLKKEKNRALRHDSKHK